MKTGVMNFMSSFHFSNFLIAIKSAGFVSKHLLNSKMSLDFAYTLYLMLMADSNIPKTQVKHYVARWFVLSTLTSRYTTSPESIMDRDIKAINEKGFLEFMSETEAAVLSDSFWDIALVQNLETSAVNSPHFNTFIAAQIHGKDNSLFMNGLKVEDLVSISGDVHHVFPVKYLKKNGVKERIKYNQVANYIYLDTQVNKSIGEKPPAEYLKKAFEQCETQQLVWGNISTREELINNLETNCIPANAGDMTVDDYGDFLRMRRQLMAAKIKNYYRSL